MYARCRICAKTWNISISQKIPKQGYICPWVREFNEAEYEKYYRAKKKAKMRKRIIFLAKAMKYVIPVLVSVVLYNTLSQRLYIERGSHEIGSEVFLVGMIGVGIFLFLSWLTGGGEN